MVSGDGMAWKGIILIMGDLGLNLRLRPRPVPINPEVLRPDPFFYFIRSLEHVFM